MSAKKRKAKRVKGWVKPELRETTKEDIPNLKVEDATFLTVVDGELQEVDVKDITFSGEAVNTGDYTHTLDGTGDAVLKQQTPTIIPGTSLSGNDPESIAEERLKMQIRELFPTAVLKEVYKLIGCECIVDAYDHFMQVAFSLTIEMQAALIGFYRELFNEKIRRSNCSSCWASRIARIRKEVATKID